jgi:nucleolar protein 12
LSKQLQRHILTFAPTAKIESVRFRSIPFQTPTSKLPTSDDEEGDSTTTSTKTKLHVKPQQQTPRKEARPHDRERASVWRSKAIDKEDEAVMKQDEKKYITPGQKKKIAFINQEFHSTANTVNAYILFAHPINTENRPSNLPPILPCLDPFKAARMAAEMADGTLFMERIIRVDLVGKNRENEAAGSSDTDPKLSVFVGNLDFASKEEDLRVFFEGLMTSERGLPPPPPPPNDDIDEELQKKPLTWVTRVRIVRDKDTQLGKGFAYIQFTVSTNPRDVT